MSDLTTDAVATACGIFLECAYPAGAENIPDDKRIWSRLPPGQAWAAYLTDPLFPKSGYQPVKDGQGETTGCALRLGCSHYPHLKMKILAKEEQGETMWVFAVDTHDAFFPGSFRPPPDHPDAPAWMQLQAANSLLKQQIESAWEHAGLMTFNALLRRGLAPKVTEDAEGRPADSE